MVGLAVHSAKEYRLVRFSLISVFDKHSPFILFPKAIGYRLYIIALFAFVSTLLESVGLSMIAPLVSNTLEVTSATGGYYKSVLSFIDSIHFFVTDNLQIKIFIFLISLFYLKSIGIFCVGYSIALLKAQFLEKIRANLIDRLLCTPVSELANQQPSFYSNLLVDQADRSIVSLGFFIQAVTKYLSAFLYLCFGLLLAPKFGMIALIASACVVFVFKIVSAQVNKISLLYAERNSSLAKLITSIVENLKYLTVTGQKAGPLISSLNTSVSDVCKLQRDLTAKEALTVASRDAVIITVLGVVLIPHMQSGSEISVNLVSILLLYRSMSAVLMAQKVLQNSQEYFGSFLHIQNFDCTGKAPAPDIPIGQKLVDGSGWEEISLKNISKRFQNRDLFQNLNLQIRKGAFVCITGPSGSGKSTLVDIIAGITEPSSGDIEIVRNENCTLSPRCRVGYVTQSNAIFQGTVLQNATMWADSINLSEVVHVLKEMELISGDDLDDRFLNRTVDQLSGGERQRLAFAREIYRCVDILILDEPTSALDAESRDLLLKKINELANDVTIIAITHDREFAAQSDFIYTIAKKN